MSVGARRRRLDDGGSSGGDADDATERRPAHADRPAPMTGTLTVQVNDGDRDTPVAGAHVVAFRQRLA